MQCVLVHATGAVEVLCLHQRDVSARLGGAVTFVGAVTEAQAFAVGLRDAAHLPVNVACTDPARFDTPVRGPVLFVGTDDEGEETSVERAVLLACLEIKCES